MQSFDLNMFFPYFFMRGNVVSLVYPLLNHLTISRSWLGKGGFEGNTCQAGHRERGVNSICFPLDHILSISVSMPGSYSA